MIPPVVLLDVSVPMYAAGRAHPLKEACAWVMTEVAARRLVAAIDTEIVQEILSRYGALQEWRLAVTMATDLLTLVPTVYPVRATEARLTIELFAEYAPRGVTARDLVHVAVMMNNGLRHIISTDRHFDSVSDITRLDPQVLFSQRTA